MRTATNEYLIYPTGNDFWRCGKKKLFLHPLEKIKDELLPIKGQKEFCHIFLPFFVGPWLLEGDLVGDLIAFWGWNKGQIMDFITYREKAKNPLFTLICPEYPTNLARWGTFYLGNIAGSRYLAVAYSRIRKREISAWRNKAFYVLERETFILIRFTWKWERKLCV